MPSPFSAQRCSATWHGSCAFYSLVDDVEVGPRGPADIHEAGPHSTGVCPVVPNYRGGHLVSQRVALHTKLPGNCWK